MSGNSEARSPARGPGLAVELSSAGGDLVGLGALGALDDLEVDPLALFEALVPVHLDGRVVDEDVLTAVDGDEAEALLGVEPLHGALCHVCSHVRATDDPSRSGGRVLALPPVEHERGTRTARKGTTRTPGIPVIHAESIPDPAASSPGPVRRRQLMRPAARADFSDGSTRWVGPTTGSSGSSVFSPSPVLRTTVSLAGSSRPSSTSWRSTATVTPPAVSAKTPVVRARSRMPWTIASSPTRPTDPPVRRIASSA